MAGDCLPFPRHASPNAHLPQTHLRGRRRLKRRKSCALPRRVGGRNNLSACIIITARTPPTTTLPRNTLYHSIFLSISSNIFAVVTFSFLSDWRVSEAWRGSGCGGLIPGLFPPVSVEGFCDSEPAFWDISIAGVACDLLKLSVYFKWEWQGWDRTPRLSRKAGMARLAYFWLAVGCFSIPPSLLTPSPWAVSSRPHHILYSPALLLCGVACPQVT